MWPEKQAQFWGPLWSHLVAFLPSSRQNVKPKKAWESCCLPPGTELGCGFPTCHLHCHQAYRQTVWDTPPLEYTWKYWIYFNLHFCQCCQLLTLPALLLPVLWCKFWIRLNFFPSVLSTMWCGWWIRLYLHFFPCLHQWLPLNLGQACSSSSSSSPPPSTSSPSAAASTS